MKTHQRFWGTPMTVESPMCHSTPSPKNHHFSHPVRPALPALLRSNLGHHVLFDDNGIELPAEKVDSIGMDST